MNNCLYCEKEITSKKYANNIKYCCTRHRVLHYAQQGKFTKAQRKFRNKKHDKPFREARQCVLCDRWYRAVCYHAWQAHGVDERSYKEIAGLDHKKGLIPKRLKKIKSKHVFKNKTILNLKNGKKTQYKKGDPRAGKYKRSPQTLKRLRNNYKKKRRT